MTPARVASLRTEASESLDADVPVNFAPGEIEELLDYASFFETAKARIVELESERDSALTRATVAEQRAEALANELDFAKQANEWLGAEVSRLLVVCHVASEVEELLKQELRRNVTARSSPRIHGALLKLERLYTEATPEATAAKCEECGHLLSRHDAMGCLVLAGRENACPCLSGSGLSPSTKPGEGGGGTGG
jgi:hypothetical protein